MSSKHLFSWVMIALSLTLLPSCGGSGKPKVGFVTNNPAEFWLHCEKGAQKAAEEEGVELDFRRPPNGTAREQEEIVNAMLAKGVKAISISVKDPKNQVESLNKVADKIPLIAVDNDASESKRKLYIGTNNVKAGRTVGKLVKEAMSDGGVIALFVGQLEPINARERAQGVLEELGFENGALESKDGKYRLQRLEPYTDNVDSVVAQSNAAGVLVKLKEEKNVCLIGLWAYNPPAILKAVKDADRLGEVHIIGFDEDLNTLQGIMDGHIYGTVVQNPYQFGYQAVKIMAALARGENVDIPKDGLLYIDERIVTREGGDGRLVASEFREEIKKQLGK